MLNEYASKSQLRRTRPSRTPIVAAIATALLVPLMLASLPSEASATSASYCARAHKACISDCKKWAPFEFRKACFDRCATDFNRCVGVVTTPAPEPFHFWRWKRHKHRHDDPKDPSKPPKPPKPPRTDNHTPPTGGTKPDPKPTPPKVNDTRPPMGGGVFQPKTPGTISDPVLGPRGGAPTSGASGPASSNGRR